MKAVTRIDITARTIIRFLVILVGFWIVYLIRDVLLMLFAAAVIAAAIEPLAGWCEKRRIPRALTVIGVYVILLLLLSLVVSLMIPPLTEQITHLANAVPEVLAALERVAPLGVSVNQQATVTAVQQVLQRLGENIATAGVSVFEQTRSIFSGALTILFVFILAFYLVVERDALKKLFRVVIPPRHILYVEQMLDRVQWGIGRWLLAQVTLAVILGIVVGVGLSIIGVPYALVLGLLAGLLEVIPVIGPIVAAVPGIIIGFAQSWVFGVVTLVFYVLVQQAENHFLVPTIMRKATGLNPLITLVAVLLGARLAGVVGIILAVPMATILSIFWSDFFNNEAVDELAGDEN